jgi:uncharacterized protein (DUF302 family)
MLFEIESKKSLEEIGRGLEEAAARHKFGIIGVHDLKRKMLEKGVEFSNDCMIYEVCNPVQAKKVLDASGAISTALPCRISVYRSGDSFKIATILPTAMLNLFDVPGLETVAREVEDDVLAMMRETA